MLSGLIQQLNSWGLPQELILKASFYSIAGFTVASALLVVLSRNLFHSALYLAMTLIGVACVYLYLDAEFLAIVQILVYVGAIVTLFIFTIMFTADIQKKIVRRMNSRMILSACGVLVFFSILLKIILSHPWQADIPKTPPFDLSDLGKSLMTNFALPFEVLSVLALAALVGALVLGKMEKK